YHMAFKWDPKSDYFNSQLEDSVMLQRISEQTGREMEQVFEEYEKRKTVLKWLLQRGIRSYDKVAESIGKYYRDPNAMMKKIEYGG
ncbi:MAG: secretion system protein E, partial [Nitrosarchaeum sp.]